MEDDATVPVLAPLLCERYRLGPAIGRGGMATVHRAHDELLGRDVAIKMFAPVLDAAELTRPQAEARILGAFAHPNLVRLLDVGVQDGADGTRQMFLVLELVEGADLAARLADGPLGPDLTARLGAQVAGALALVHEEGVAHRDLKPGNILLAGERTAPTAKVADFGIARVVDGTRMTLTGTTLGTVSYLSPEQACGEPVATPSDVYSLGLVLVECLTGRKAFEGTPAEVAAARLTGPPPLPEHVGAHWRSLLAAMTALEPGARPTAAEVARELAALASGGDRSATLSTPATPWSARRPVRARPRVAAAAAAALLALGGGVWGLTLASASRGEAGAAVPAEPAATSQPALPGPLGDALDELSASVHP